MKKVIIFILVSLFLVDSNAHAQIFDLLPLQKKKMNKQFWMFPGNFKWGMSQKKVMKEATKVGYKLETSIANRCYLRYSLPSVPDVTEAGFLFTSQKKLIYIAVVTNSIEHYKKLIEKKCGIADKFPNSQTYQWLRKGDLVTVKKGPDLGVVNYGNINYSVKYSNHILSTLDEVLQHTKTTSQPSYKPKRKSKVICSWCGKNMAYDGVWFDDNPPICMECGAKFTEDFLKDKY